MAASKAEGAGSFMSDSDEMMTTEEFDKAHDALFRSMEAFDRLVQEKMAEDTTGATESMIRKQLAVEAWSKSTVHIEFRGNNPRRKPPRFKRRYNRYEYIPPAKGSKSPAEGEGSKSQDSDSSN